MSDSPIDFKEAKEKKEIQDLAQEAMANQQQQMGDRRHPVSDGTHYVIRYNNNNIHSMTASYLCWAITYFKNIPLEDIFVLAEHEVDTVDHPTGSTIYKIGYEQGTEITHIGYTFIYINHPYDVYEYLIFPNDNRFPYCEVLKYFFGEREYGENNEIIYTGQNPEYVDCFIEGQSLFDISVKNMSHWGVLFEEEKYLIEEPDASQEEPASSKFDKYRSKASKKKKDAKEKMRKNYLHKDRPSRFYRQEIYNAGLILRSHAELVERFLAHNMSFVMPIIVTDDTGVYTYNFVALNAFEPRFSALEHVFDPNQHTGTIYYQQISPELYKVNLFTEGMPHDAMLALENAINQVALDANPHLDIYRVIKNKIVDNEKSMLTANIFMKREDWDAWMDMTSFVSQKIDEVLTEIENRDLENIPVIE